MEQADQEIEEGKVSKPSEWGSHPFQDNLSKKNHDGGPEKGHNDQHHVSSAAGFLHSFRVNEIQ